MGDQPYLNTIEIGYSRGFNCEPLIAEIDNFRVKKRISMEEKKEKFEEIYKENYIKGGSDRDDIYRVLKYQFKQIAEKEEQILSDFLKYICEHFWGASLIFDSWLERLNYELGINQIEELLTINDITKLLVNRKLQQAIHEIKRCSLSESNNEIYFRILLKDLSLKVARDKSKKKQISSNQYQKIIKSLNSEVLDIIEKLNNFSQQ